EQKVDCTGRIVGLSGGGKILTVEMFPPKSKEPTLAQIRLTKATRESYHGVAADGARPAVGYLVQVWLAEGSQDTAARVRFTRNDERKSLDGKIVAVSADGGRFTLEMPSGGKDGEATRREITVTASSRLVFFKVGPGRAKLTEGYHVRGWLVPGSGE